MVKAEKRFVFERDRIVELFVEASHRALLPLRLGAVTQQS